MSDDIQGRYESLMTEMLSRAVHYAAVNKHWLLYSLLGWEHLITCIVCHMMLVNDVTLRLPYLGVYTIQIVVALVTLRLFNRRLEQPAVLKQNRKIWTMFILLCLNVAMLNVVAGHPVFVFLPVLATLSSFAFAMMCVFFSKRFAPAAFTMFLSGIVIARTPQYGFLIYGAAWLLVLQTLGVIFYKKRASYITGIISQVGPSSDPTKEICLNPTEKDR